MQQPSFLRFAELPEGYKRAVIACALGLLGIATVAFAISYSALYAYARDSGLYSSRMARLYPLMLDLPVILGMGVSVVLAALRGNRFWPFAIVAVCGALTVWFNVQHAGTDPGYRLMAAVPPVLVVMCIEAFLTLIHSVRKQLGHLAPLPYPGHAYPTSVQFGYPQMAYGPPVYGQLPAPGVLQSPIAANGQSGHALDPPVAANGQTGQPVTGDELKRRIVEQYLAGWSPVALQATTAQEIEHALKGEGFPMSERTIASVLSEVRARHGIADAAPNGTKRTGTRRTTARKRKT